MKTKITPPPGSFRLMAPKTYVLNADCTLVDNAGGSRAYIAKSLNPDNDGSH